MKKSTWVVGMLVAFLVTFMIFLPIIVALPQMFESKKMMFAYPFTFFPKEFTIENFSRLFYLQYTSAGVNYFTSLLMTILVSSLAVIFSLTINMLAAYAFARLRFPLKKLIFGIMIVTMFIPGITILITSYRVVYLLGLLNTIFVLIIPGLANAYNIFFFRQFFLGFPKELDEAARIDGCSSVGIFARIYLPMSKTPAIIIGASIFIGYYNSYLWPMMTIDNEHKNLYQMMYLVRVLFSDSSSIGYGSVLAATFIAMIPPLIVFVLMQKHIKDGIAMTGIK